MCGQIFTLIITAILLDGVFGWENYFLSDYHPQINGWANIYINHHPHISGWGFWVGTYFYLTNTLKSMGGQIFTLIITPISLGGIFGWEILFYLITILRSMGGQIFTALNM